MKVIQLLENIVETSSDSEAVSYSASAVVTRNSEDQLQ